MSCSYKKRIGIIGGLGNEAMVDQANKIAQQPGSDAFEFIAFGNSRQAHKHFEVGEVFPEDHPSELRRKHTVHFTLQLMQHLGVDVAGLSCNSFHILYRNVLPKLSLNFVDMIHQTAQQQEGSREPILVMGVNNTVQSGIYQSALKQRSIASSCCGIGNQTKVMEAIYNPEFGIKTTKITSKAEQLLCEVITQEHKAQGIRRVILGCTELPLALNETSCQRFRKEGLLPEDVEVIDASMVLAQSLLKGGRESNVRSSLSDFSMTSRLEYTDWQTPMTVEVSSLSSLANIQERVFELTKIFLSERNQNHYRQL